MVKQIPSRIPNDIDSSFKELFYKLRQIAESVEDEELKNSIKENLESMSFYYTCIYLSLGSIEPFDLGLRIKWLKEEV